MSLIQRNHPHLSLAPMCRPALFLLAALSGGVFSPQASASDITVGSPVNGTKISSPALIRAHNVGCDGVPPHPSATRSTIPLESFWAQLPTTSTSQPKPFLLEPIRSTSSHGPVAASARPSTLHSRSAHPLTRHRRRRRRSAFLRMPFRPAIWTLQAAGRRGMMVARLGNPEDRWCIRQALPCMTMPASFT